MLKTGQELELEPHLVITLASVLGTLSDYAATKIALKYPELRETNPNVNFGNELLFAVVGGVSLYSIAKLIKQPTNLSIAIGLIPPAVPFMVAINNLAWIVWAHRKQYPWKEMPLLYPE